MSKTDEAVSINWDTVDGAAWAAEDDAIAREYAGKWVVALPGRIVAAGDDIDRVSEEASRILGVEASTIHIRAITHPDEWFKDYPFSAGVSSTQAAG